MSELVGAGPGYLTRFVYRKATEATTRVGKHWMVEQIESLGAERNASTMFGKSKLLLEGRVDLIVARTDSRVAWQVAPLVLGRIRECRTIEP